jgi:nucleotide-binding universal stress UspA family protein
MINHVSQQRPILVAVVLRGQDEPVLATARTLARKLHAPLHLVHAVRPMFSYVGAGDLAINPYYGYEMNFNDKEEQSARAKLEALRTSLDDVAVDTHLIRDFPAEAVLSLADEINAGLIIMGVGEDNGGLLSGVSTEFTLASEALAPVLLVPSKIQVPFEGPLRILVADNLGEEGQAALMAAVKCANDLHAESLSHVHVQDMSIQDVDRMIESVRESMILGQIPSDPDLNRDYYMEQVRARTQDELIKRYEGLTENQLNSTRYEATVRFGRPAEEIHQEVNRIGAQMMVFGRHHRLHRKTLSLGRIPYSAMVEDGVATLVVPEVQTNLSERAIRETKKDVRVGSQPIELHNH